MFIDLFQRFALCQIFIFTQIGIRYVNTVNRQNLAAASGRRCYRVFVLTERTAGNKVNRYVKLIISNSSES